MKRSDLTQGEKWIRPIAIGAGIGAGVCFCVLALGALALSMRDVPLAVVPILATAALVVGGFVSGYACTRITRERGLLLGAAGGSLFFLLLYMASIPENGVLLGGQGITSWITVVFASALGGVLGVNQKRKFQ